jgi:hypothetical protein
MAGMAGKQSAERRPRRSAASRVRRGADRAIGATVTVTGVGGARVTVARGAEPQIVALVLALLGGAR